MAVAVSDDLGDNGGSQRRTTVGDNVGDDMGDDVGNGDDCRDNAGNDPAKGMAGMLAGRRGGFWRRT